MSEPAKNRSPIVWFSKRECMLCFNKKVAKTIFFVCISEKNHMTGRVVPRKKNFHRYHHMFEKYKYPTRNMTEERSLTDEVQQLHIVTPLTAQMFQ